MSPEEESDEEWARIADAVGVIEAQYLSDHTHGTSNPPTHSDPRQAPPAVSPQSVAATPVPPGSGPLQQANAYQNTSNGQPDAPNRPPNTSSVHANAYPPDYNAPQRTNAQYQGLPNRSANANPSSLPHGPSNTTNAEYDPYARAIQEKDARIQQLESERRGEVANYRNKLQTLQTQLQAARGGRIRPHGAAPATSTLAPRIAQLEDEKARLARELASSQREAQIVRDRLAFAEHELAGARDRERTHLAALREHGPGRPRSASARSGGGLTQAQPTQAGDVVEATQQIGVVSSQGYSMHRSSIQRPVRRRRRPTSASGSAAPSGSAPLSVPKQRRAAVDNPRAQGSSAGSRPASSATPREENRPSSKRKPHSVQTEPHGWGVRLSEATWEHSALREAIFGGNLGERLLDLSHREKDGTLRDAILGAMASDSGWVRLMEVLLPLQGVSRGATLAVGECIDQLLVFSGPCRSAVGNGVVDVFEGTKKCLEQATKANDPRTAVVCMRVLLGGACGIAEVGSGEKAEMRDAVRCEVTLDWIRGSKSLNRKGNAREVAVLLAEAACELIMEAGAEEDSTVDDEGENGEGTRGDEWAFVERAFRTMCECVLEGQAEGDMVRVVCVLAMHAAIREPYLMSECGGGEAVAHVLTYAQHSGGQEELVQACIGALSTATITGSCGLTQQTRDVVLGVFAGVGGRDRQRVLALLARAERAEREEADGAGSDEG